MSSKEKSIASAEKKLADQYGDYTRFMGIFVRKLRDLSKQLDILSREGRSGITKDEVEDKQEERSNDRINLHGMSLL